MNFEPLTEMYFCHTGIDEQNKVVCDAQSTLYNVITRGTNVKGKAMAASFQREGPAYLIRVDHKDIPYYDLIQCDTVLFQNMEYTRSFWTIGNIISVDWKNPECSFVRYKLDHFMTYQTFIDWESSIAYVEREHVKADWASDGGNPLFSNIGPAEDIQVTPDTQVYAYSKTYQCDKVVVISPYDESGQPTFEGSNSHGLYSSLNTKVMTPGEVNNFFKQIAENKETSINNIVGVYGIPSEFESIITGRGRAPDIVENLLTINAALRQNTNFPKLNNAKTMSGPFMQVKLFSSEGDAIDFNPQWFGSDVDDYELHITGAGAGGLPGGLAAAFNSKSGLFDWKTYTDYMVMIRNFPSCPHTLDGFADWMAINNTSVAMRSLSVMHNGLTGMITGATGAMNQYNAAEASGMGEAGLNTMATTGVLNAIGSGLQMGATLAAIGASVRQAKASGATMGGVSMNSTLFDLGLSSFGSSGGWGFKVVYYSVQPYLLKSIDNYFDRFGYRVNQLKPLGVNNRPIWTFIKTAECHVNHKMRGLPFVSEMAVNRLFNQGVTLWNSDKYIGGREIGDFSNPEENRGIGG